MRSTVTGLSGRQVQSKALADGNLEALVKLMEEEPGLPVICSKAIPDGIIQRFEKWHVGNVW